MSRISQTFEALKARREKALVAFITAGDPDLETTRSLFQVLESSGADIVELGVPFSDPLADGPVIQAASQRALKAGTTLKKILRLVQELRAGSSLPIVLMTSYNPVWVFGPQKFIEEALKAGVDGVIIPDLPPEEAGDFETCAHEKGLDLIYLLAPTSTPERVRWIGSKSRGFIYYVSLTGTTGAREALADGVREKVQAIKQATPLPVLVGFGISNPESARAAADFSDGVIVGSAIVKIIGETPDSRARLERVQQFVREIKQAIVPSG